MALAESSSARARKHEVLRSNNQKLFGHEMHTNVLMMGTLPWTQLWKLTALMQPLAGLMAQGYSGPRCDDGGVSE